MTVSSPHRGRKTIWIVVTALISATLLLSILAYSFVGNQSSVKVAYIELTMVYDSPVSGFGCFGPVHQAVGEPATISPGSTLIENISLTNSVSNLTCRITNASVSSQGFVLSNTNPSLPVSVATGQTVNLSLQITTPSSGFSGPVGIDIHILPQSQKT
ncbi:MAG TPA: hypothetical protein VGR53_03360 [Nitrososphaerales archaeon]|nr:hypothetical protein [Nitrososphaerales archaeon]